MLESEAAGGDDIPVELLKAGGDEAVKVLTTMCNNVYGRIMADSHERREKGIQKLPHNCLELTRKQGTIEGMVYRVLLKRLKMCS